MPPQALDAVFAGMERVAVAVSGGVDSMTLAHLVQAHYGAAARHFHAVSPAVPEEATRRVRRHAEGAGWNLTVLDAGEFADPAYRANPLDRCYFCKSSLYGRLAAETDAVILSGTNTDDLGDFRPGLRAAAENGVRHPFVEAGIGKQGIRTLARELGLDDLAELPAAPCLSSRIETGLAIDPAELALVDAVERRLRAALGLIDLRCRVTGRGVRIELAGQGAALSESSWQADIRREVEAMIAASGHAFLGYAPYRRGSAFLREATHA